MLRLKWRDKAPSLVQLCNVFSKMDGLSTQTEYFPEAVLSFHYESHRWKLHQPTSFGDNQRFLQQAKSHRGHSTVYTTQVITFLRLQFDHFVRHSFRNRKQQLIIITTAQTALNTVLEAVQRYTAAICLSTSTNCTRLLALRD